MRIGGHDRKISIQFRSIARGTYGEVVDSFTTSFAAWARLDVKATGAREYIEDGREKASTRVVFLIRYSTDVSDITAGDRVLYNSQYYDIENVQEVGRNTSLRLFCKLVE